jgi:hypothetical protein
VVAATLNNLNLKFVLSRLKTSTSAVGIMFPHHASRQNPSGSISYQALNLGRSDWLLLILLHTPITEKAIDLGVDLAREEFLSSSSTCLTLHT